MPRLLGVDIPNDRPTAIALTYLYGVGPKTARELCHKAGVNPQAHARELGEDEVGLRIAAPLDKDYLAEGQLRRQINRSGRTGILFWLRIALCGRRPGCRDS